MMFYAGTLHESLRKKLLKKMHSNYRPRTLRKAFDLTLEFEREYKVTQPNSDFTIMETCYEDPEGKHEFTTEEVQMRSQANKQGQYQQGN